MTDDRIHELETALASVLEHVRRQGGYTTPEEQETLLRARQTLARRERR